MAGALLHRVDLVGDQLEQVAAADADVLHADVAGDVVLDAAEAAREIALQPALARDAVEVLVEIVRVLRRRRATPGVATSCGNSSRTIRLQLGDGITTA